MLVVQEPLKKPWMNNSKGKWVRPGGLQLGATEGGRGAPQAALFSARRRAVLRAAAQAGAGRVAAATIAVRRLLARARRNAVL